jgi:aerobic carbon-monoxide dehydrogenase large subunit
MIDPEHARLLAGRGRYVDDERPEGALHMAVLRSPAAHGEIVALETEAAGAVPGVRLVLSSADLAGIGPLAARATVEGMVEPRRPVLAEGRVLHVGQPVAAVVAETEAAALDALEALGLDIAERPAVIDVAAAAEAEPIWPEAPGNRAFAWERGNADETARLIAGAAHLVELTVAHPRIAIAPIEPRGCVAAFDAATGRFTLTTPSQGVVSLRTALSACLDVPPDRLRVLTHDVGGSFAAKIWPYPEHVLALLAARACGRPVRWTATRTDAFLGDAPGRGRLDRAQLALDADGRFLAFRIEALADMGAFLNTAAPGIVTQGAVRPFAQLYRIPGQHYRVEAVFTNAHPTDAYRGAGKPETTATLERLIDVAAREMGVDPLDLRERNLIRPDELPLTTPMGETMDAGDFPAVARAIREAADREGVARRKAESRARGLFRGASIGFHLHATGGSTAERSEVRALPDGTVLVRTGAQDSGQSHRATLALVAAEALDLAPGRIRVEQGDSDGLEIGGGTGGSNLMPVAGNTVHRAALEMLARARALASEMLEAAEADIDYAGGAFRIAGTDRVATLAEVAAHVPAAGADDAPGCVAELDFAGVHTTWPNGAFACEVEVDPETGAVRVDRFIGVDDLGRVFNAPAAEGQLMGGIAQGIGEALMEGVRLDSDGQPLNASFMDYALPRAADLPPIGIAWAPTESPNAPIGAKGVGELGSIGAPGVVVNAVLDALAPHGARHLDMPLTPEKVWRALRSGRGSGQGPGRAGGR